MKVLSLTEPFATLIKDHKKRIETRSFKTNYRGELYIHASSTKIPRKWRDDSKLMELVESSSFSYGYIICKCKLVDCILMTPDYISFIRKNYPTEFICGIYEAGRYAWILDDIEVLSQPILAKGHLGIWNYEL